MTKVQTNSQGKVYVANNKALLASSPVITSLSITPTTSAQTITAPSGTDGYSPITVSAVTSSIDSNISAENIKKDVQILGVTGSYEGSGGGGGSSGKYALLDRVKDDNNVEIGTVCGFFTDANDMEYAVVCLDARYRNWNTQWCSANVEITNLPLYNNVKTSNIWGTKETATFNTQKILDYCSSHSATSSACSHCRSQSFVIEGVTYNGQLPNVYEIVYINQYYNTIETMDTSASSQTSTNFSEARSFWGSNQSLSSSAWYIQTNGIMGRNTKTGEYVMTCPVLEIPNA